MSGTVARKIDAKGTDGRCTAAKDHVLKSLSTMYQHHLANQAGGPGNEQFDLVVRNARVATASDTFDADIGIVDGRIVQLGSRPARRRARDRRRRPLRHARRRRCALPPRPADGRRRCAWPTIFDTGTRCGRLRRHDHGDPVRRAAEGPVAARRGATTTTSRAEGRAHVDSRLPPDRQRPDRRGAEARAAAADRARATPRSRST